VPRPVGASLVRPEPNITLVAKAAQALCEFVSSGHGISLVLPIIAREFEQRLVIRPFSPDTVQDFRICRSKEGRNARVIADFVLAAKDTAKTFFSR
jgi:DNA-binding transcriptional LysR family regulator